MPWPGRKPTLCERRQRFLYKLTSAIASGDRMAMQDAFNQAMQEPGLKSTALELTCPFRVGMDRLPGLTYRDTTSKAVIPPDRDVFGNLLYNTPPPPTPAPPSTPTPAPSTPTPSPPAPTPGRVLGVLDTYRQPANSLKGGSFAYIQGQNLGNGGAVFVGGTPLDWIGWTPSEIHVQLPELLQLRAGPIIVQVGGQEIARSAFQFGITP